ncbi:MAG: APC family permease, partial [Chloroflexota bacterium]|nr:APC family permease [Chloroflexota bacterium]
MTSQSTLEPSLSSVSNDANGDTSDRGSDRRSIEGAQPSGHLPAVLTRRDLTMFMVLALLLISNNNGVQFGGPVVFLYWAIGLVTFLLPCAIVTRWLGRLFPGQGAPYLWATHVLGSRWSFFSAFCAWVPGIFAIVSTLETSIAFIQYLVPAWFVTPGQQCVAMLLLLLIATAITCIPLRWLRHLLVGVGILCVSVYLLMGAAGIWWLWSGHSAAVAFNQLGAWQLNGGNFALYGLIVLAFLGVDLPLFMGGEIRGGRTAMKHASNYVWWGAVLSFAAYVAGTFGIMVVVPPSQAGTMGANIEVISRVFGSYTGNTIAVVVALSQLIVTVAYILMFSRLLVIVAQDRRLPIMLTKTNRFGVPVLSIIVQTVLAAFVTVLAFFILPILFGKVARSVDIALDVYMVMVATGSALWLFSTTMLFCFVLTFLYTNKQQLAISKGRVLFLITTSLIGGIASLIGIWSIVSASWTPTLIPDDRWAILVWSAILVTLIAGLLTAELPRVRAQLNEQRRLNGREIVLREQLQQAFDEQETLVMQQQELLSEVDRLYREQALAAVTDAITGLPNHRAIITRLEEEI